MNDAAAPPVIRQIADMKDSLSPKSRIIGNFIIRNPNKAVFMTIKKLAKACNVSEASVVRFVAALGYNGYSEFLQALKEVVNTGMTLPDRADMSGISDIGLDRLQHVLLEEIDNIKYLYETIDMEKINRLVAYIDGAKNVFITGSRLSYTFAYYFGWSLTKIMKGVQILKGSDSTAIDMISTAPADSLVVLFATTRYPNELIRLSRLVRRLNLSLLVITDSHISPVIQFADLSVVIPSKSIPFIGNVANMACVIQYIIEALAGKKGKALQAHQEQLEQVYLENDILFNLLPK